MGGFTLSLRGAACGLGAAGGAARGKSTDGDFPGAAARGGAAGDDSARFSSGGATFAG